MLSVSYLELATEKFAEVLRLDSQDAPVNVELAVAADDGQVGEET